MCVALRHRKSIYSNNRRRSYHRRRGFKTVKVVLCVFLLAALIFIGYMAAGPIYSSIEKWINTKKPLADTNEGNEVVNKEDDTTPPDNNGGTDIHEEQPPDDPGLVEPVEIIPTRSVFISVETLTEMAEVKRLAGIFRSSAINTIVITVKDENGKLKILSDIESVVRIEAIDEAAVDITDALNYLKLEGFHTVVGISCFLDDYAPRKLRSAAISVRKNVLWFDKREKRWLDAYSQEAWSYISSIAVGMIDYGFDEVMLFDVMFPEIGKLELINYSNTYDKSSAIETFINTTAQAVHEKSGKLSLYISAITAVGQATEVSGQQYKLSQLDIDALYPNLSPGLLPYKTRTISGVTLNGTFYENPNITPYETVNDAIIDILARLGNSLYDIVPIIQTQTVASLPAASKYTYGRIEIEQQIDALKEHGVYNYAYNRSSGVYDDLFE